MIGHALTHLGSHTAHALSVSAFLHDLTLLMQHDALYAIQRLVAYLF